MSTARPSRDLLLRLIRRDERLAKERREEHVATFSWRTSKHGAHQRDKGLKREEADEIMKQMVEK